MSGFTLNLNIAGLCLMVPDYERTAKRVLHVLLPPCNHGGELHIPALVFDQAAETKDKAPTHLPGRVDFPDAEFDLSSQASNPPIKDPPAALADLTGTFGARVPVKFLDGNTPGAEVNARVRFAAGDPGVPACGAGAFFFFPDEFDPDTNPHPLSPQLPNRTLWTMQVPADFLDVQFMAINGSVSTPRNVKLFPWKGTLDLWVFNSPEAQLPTSFPPVNIRSIPKPVERAEHFACFYPLTDDTTEVRVPVFHHLATIPTSCFVAVTEPGLDVMCIGAVADPKP